MDEVAMSYIERVYDFLFSPMLEEQKLKERMKFDEQMEFKGTTVG